MMPQILDNNVKVHVIIHEKLRNVSDKDNILIPHANLMLWYNSMIKFHYQVFHLAIFCIMCVLN